LGIVRDPETGQLRAPAKWIYAVTALVPQTRLPSAEALRSTFEEGQPEYKRQRGPSDLLASTLGIKTRPMDLKYARDEYLKNRLSKLRGATNFAERYGAK